MADSTTENGLPLFSSLDVSSKDPKDKKSQSELYLKNAHLPQSKYSDGLTYVASAPENGLSNMVYNHNENSDAPTYVERINKNGSAILAALAKASGPSAQ